MVPIQKQMVIKLSDAVNGTMPYEKADAIQPCALGDDVALTFHQINYQAAADEQQKKDADPSLASTPLQGRTIIVGRVVMNRVSFDRFLEVVKEFQSKLPPIGGVKSE